MTKLLAMTGAALVAVVLGSSAAWAGEPADTPTPTSDTPAPTPTATSTPEPEPTVDDVKAAFEGLTRSDVEDMGYVVDDQCVTAADAGAPAELGAMGFHGVNEALIDDQLDPLEPEAVVLDADGNVVAVEYLAPANSGLSLFGEDLVFVPPLNLDALHLWLIENPNGQFADFNPNVTCPAALPETGVGGAAADGGNGLLIAWIAVGAGALSLAGATWALRRRQA